MLDVLKTYIALLKAEIYKFQMVRLLKKIFKIDLSY